MIVMSRSLLASAALTLSVALNVSAVQAQEPIKVTESVLVGANAADTWSLVSNFADLGAWHPAISKTEIANGDPTMRGAVRVLTVGDNVGTVTETLTAFDDEGMSFSYVINSTDALPVQDYGSTVQVIGVGDGAAMVVWNADFLAKGAPDADVAAAMSGVYRAGLDNLASMME